MILLLQIFVTIGVYISWYLVMIRSSHLTVQWKIDRWHGTCTLNGHIIAAWPSHASTSDGRHTHYWAWPNKKKLENLASSPRETIRTQPMWMNPCKCMRTTRAPSHSNVHLQLVLGDIPSGSFPRAKVSVLSTLCLRYRSSLITPIIGARACLDHEMLLRSTTMTTHTILQETSKLLTLLLYLLA
jgi:hypothetical protein